MVKFVIGAAGSGKSTEMIRIIDALSDTNAQICIIVPEQFSYEFDKNLYKKIGARKFNNLFSLSFTGLARQLFQLYGDDKRCGEYADETARMIMVYQALLSIQGNPDSKRVFNKQMGSAGFAEEVLKLIGDMKKAGITPDELISKAAFLDNRLMDKTNDIALIYLEYERLMREYDFKDNWDDISEAAAVAGRSGYFRNKTVFLDEFESFTGDQLDFVETIINHADDVYISLRTDDVNAGEFTLFETVNDTYRRLARICRKSCKEFELISCNGDFRFRSSDLSFLSRNILRNEASHTGDRIPQPENIRIFEAKDYYSESDYVCATIKRLLYSDQSLRFSDIAVIANNIEDYADVLEAALERYEIPYFLSLEKSVMHTAIMIFFSTFLNLLTRRNYSSELIFRYMKCGLLDVSLTEVSLLENYCYKWGIDGATWTQKFSAPDKDLELLELVREKIITPLEKIRRKLVKKISAKDFSALVYNHLVACGAQKQLAGMIGDLITENKDYTASELKRLWACLIDILDSISDTLGDQEYHASELKSIINSLISRIKYSVPPQTLDSVTIASARTARLNAPKIVFVMGANDGDFPNIVNLHGIFSETDKEKLFENGIEISRRLPELIASERLIVYKSLSAASEKLYISYSLSDLSGQMKFPAPVIDSIMKLFDDKSIRISEDQLTSDYYAVTMKSAYYKYMQDIKLKDEAILSIEMLLQNDIEYRRRLSYAANTIREFGTYRVSTSLVEKLKKFEPMRISPSSFEMYNRCHFQYFCQECLKLIQREKIDLDVRYAGNIIHNCFYNIISSRDKNAFISMSYSELEKEISQAADKYLKENMGGDFSKTPRFELGFKKLSERLTRVFVHTQQELMASSFLPHSFEINLRDKNVNMPLILPFADDKTLSFGGIIDRADVCDVDGEKYVRIVDYKSGKKKIDKYTLSSGINMQMLLYLFAITQDKGLFSGYKPAGVLYSPVTISSLEAENVREKSENTAVINSSLKMSGLVLGEKELLEAMEHDVQGKFIPAKLTKQNEIDKRSSCISEEALLELEGYTYKKLQNMAESVYSGNADASPLVFSETDNPCLYCNFSNMCGIIPGSNRRNPYEADLTEIEAILEKKTSDESDKINEGGND